MSPVNEYLETSELDRMPTHVLVVDDDEPTRLILKAILNKHDCKVLHAADGEQGWSVFRSNPVDVVLCDWQMPNMDGLELMAKIKQLDADMPVIVVSGEGGMQQVVEALRLGAFDYITKPWGAPDVVWHAVEQALHSSRLLNEKRSAEQALQKAYSSLSDQMQQLQDDQNAAASVQRGMLPRKVASIHVYDIAFEWLPMLTLSGDFIEYFPIGEHHLGFFVADVSGHGTSSGLVTVLLKGITNRLKNSFDEQAEEAVLDPTRWFDEINRELLDSGLGKHVAMFAGVLNLTSGHLAYTGAAHLPPAYIVSADAIEPLEGQGLPIGVIPGAEWALRYSHLPESARLVVMSDGVLEVIAGETVLESEKNVEAVLRSSAGELSALMEALKDQNADSQLDDLSILTIYRRESTASAVD